jgi:uncharacterized protein
MAETTADDPDRGALGAGIATLAYFGMLAGHFSIGPATQLRGTVSGLWISEALAIALPAFFVLRTANLRMAPYLGLRAPTWRALGIAVFAGIANQPVVSLLTWAARLLLPPDWVEDFDSKQRMLEAIFSTQAAPFIVCVTVAAPLGEEVFFRGFALPAFRRSFGTLPAVLVTGAMFSAIHVDRVGFIGLWEIGILLAFLRLATGSLWTAIVCHAVNNGIAAIAFLQGWQDPESPPSALVLLLGGVLLVAGILLARRVLQKPARFAMEVAQDPSVPAGSYRFRSPVLFAVWLGAVLLAVGQILNVVVMPTAGWIVLCAIAAATLLPLGRREASRG